MRKVLFIATVCLAVLACSKESPQGRNSSNLFEEGQVVTITVGSSPSSKVTSSLNTNTGSVNFLWQTGDQIKVAVGSNSATFTVSRLIDGGMMAEFTGTMPGSGSSFDIQYPVAGLNESALANQTYSATVPIPSNKLLATATVSDFNSFISLEHHYSAVRLNLWGDRTIGKIVVTKLSINSQTKASDPGTDPTYTLTCGSGVSTGVSESSATPFFIVLPAGTYRFKAEIFDNSATPVSICSYTTTTSKSFAQGTILNMPPKKVDRELEPVTINGVLWAPYNCGYDATNFPYGKYYQFGRQVGGGYASPEAVQTSVLAANSWGGDYPNYHPADDKFYYYSSSPYDWYSGIVGRQLSSWLLSGPNGTSGIGNPCPDGWRVPTEAELLSLVSASHTLISNGGPAGNQTGYLYGTSPNQLFMPFAGMRRYSDGTANYRNSQGFYWSMTTSDIYAKRLNISSSNAGTTADNERANGETVRCVKSNDLSGKIGDLPIANDTW